MKNVWIGLAAVLVVYACSDSLGEVLEDAGTMLQDAGEQMQDGGAQAQQSKNVVCDKTYTRTPPDGAPQEIKYALIDVGAKGFPDVTLRQVYRSQYNPSISCPEGWSCSGLPFGKLVLETHHATFIDGYAFVQSCPGPDAAPESVTILY